MKYQHHLAAGLCGFVLLSGIVSTATAETGQSWNPSAVDFNALGLVAISSTSNSHKAPEQGAMDRTASYRVAFSQAGSYDLYVRWIPGSFYFGNSFGDTPQWLELKGAPDPMGAYVWVNLSEKFGHKKTGNLTFEVKAPGSETFKIAARTRDTRIDAFVFGKADGKFTDAQLDAAMRNHPAAEAAGLVGFQAEAAIAFGKETVPEEVRKMQAEYSERLNGLTKEIKAALPKHDEAKVAAWLAAVKAEEEPAKEAAATAKAVATLQAAEGKLGQMEENLKYGPTTLEDAQEELARARARGEENPERAKELENAEKFLASRQKDLERLQSGIENARAVVEKAKAELPAAIKAADAAKKAYESAMATTWKAMDALGMDGILGSTALDGKLAKAMVIASANPHDLAKFAAKSPEHKNLIEQLLSNEALTLQMLVADGPTGGKYGEAMKIYTDIQKASPKAKDGVFQRIALAVSLAHAVPIEKQATTGGDSMEGDGAGAGGASANIIDPVKRYLSYEKWYQDGELDPGFKDLSVWNMAMAVNANDPDEILAWGREMLRNLRPDSVPDNGDTSLYVDVVNMEIRYGSGDVQYDRPELALMQNILANGGICGRRAFFGRFALQAFGIPTAARKEPGHATLAHWHPAGWATRLGGESKPGHDWRPGGRGFYASMNDSRTRSYGADVNFQASSKAREDATAFMRVKRAQWIGQLVGEEPKPGLITWSGKSRGPKPLKPGEVEKPIFWNELALHEQRRIIAGLKSAKSASSGTAPVAATEPKATGKVTIDNKGVITIPSAACSSPTESTKALYRGGHTDQIVFLKDKAGNTVLHLSRYSNESDTFEYTFDAPKAGKYQLVASVVTPKWHQRLFATANGGTPVEMPLPYTIGLWGKTEPVVIELKAGTNVLKFHGPARATLGQFTLTPTN
jgi:chemotaxis protein histidine kinase CheA